MTSNKFGFYNLNIPFNYQVERRKIYAHTAELEGYALCVKDGSPREEISVDNSYENKLYLGKALNITDILKAENFIDNTEKKVENDLQSKEDTIVEDYYTEDESEFKNEISQVDRVKNTEEITATEEMSESLNVDFQQVSWGDPAQVQQEDSHEEKLLNTEIENKVIKSKNESSFLEINPNATANYNALDILQKLKMISKNTKES